MHQNEGVAEIVLGEVQNFLDTLRKLIVNLKLATDLSNKVNAY